MCFVYFIQSLKNNKVYIGSTTKTPEERLLEHNQGSNKFTSQNKPFKLIYFEEYICEADCKNRERFYKTGFGKQIKSIIVKYLAGNSLDP